MNRPTTPEEITEWIDKYISCRMDASDRAHFEAALLEDYELAAQLEEQLQARSVLDNIFMEERLRSQIRKLQSEEKRRFVLSKLWKYSAAACIVLVGCFGFLLTSLPVFPDSENDFTVIRGADESVMRPDRRLIFDRFFAGQAHIAEGQYALAAVDFELVLQEKDLRSYFREAAEWHLIVAYLKSGSLTKAGELYQHFSSCEDCEYQVSRVNRWKIWLQIQYSRVLS